MGLLLRASASFIIFSTAFGTSQHQARGQSRSRCAFTHTNFLPQRAASVAISKRSCFIKELIAVECGKQPVIAIPGGGIYFWWQAGAIKSLQRHYDLKQAHFMGASAGALTAALAASEVDMDKAFAVAQRLAVENGIWERPGGLMGIWGGIIREWLDECLPVGAEGMCRGRLSVAVAQVRASPRFLRRQLVSDFESREDLIDACLASVHIPFFLDRRPWRNFRGVRCVDGSVTSLLRGNNWHVKSGDPTPTMIFEHAEDRILQEKNWGFLETISEASFREMFDCGYQYMEALHTRGELCERDATMLAIKLTCP